MGFLMGRQVWNRMVLGAMEARLTECADIVFIGRRGSRTGLRHGPACACACRSDSGRLKGKNLLLAVGC